MSGEIVKTDLVLIEEIRGGNRKAFSEIVKRYQRPILRLTMRFVKDVDTAQDVTQETFIKAYEKLGTFEGRSQFKSWLFQIAVNTARNKLREARQNMTDLESVHLAIAPEAETGLLSSALAQSLQQEVEKLPFKQRTALVLRIYEDLSFKEIADIMECPYDTAKANYRHALLKLREAFSDESELKTWRSDMGGFFTEISRLAEVDT